MATDAERAGTVDLGAPGRGATGFSVESPSERVLSDERLAEVVDGVFRLREHWIRRGPGFHTLGLALYKDGQATGGLPPGVEESNARLMESFGPALEDLRVFLSRQLGGPVEWGERLPLPGFHVFEADGLRAGRATGDSHFDIQYIWAGFGEPVLDAISVTVPVRVPAAGTSLEYWEVDFAQYERLYREETVDELADAEKAFPMHEVAYEPGRACLMRGLPLHRIGTTPEVRPDDHRITLQGHAVLLGDRWVAYW
jgi:hypothetical protein